MLILYYEGYIMREEQNRILFIDSFIGKNKCLCCNGFMITDECLCCESSKVNISNTN